MAYDNQILRKIEKVCSAYGIEPEYVEDDICMRNANIIIYLIAKGYDITIEEDEVVIGKAVFNIEDLSMAYYIVLQSMT